jgi:DNA-directed RNA polymerase sigma subunit (sigma70/sigma32)
VGILREEALRDALENLSYRERRVLELRYGRSRMRSACRRSAAQPTRATAG